MDAILRIELALASLPANADSPWTNLDKMPYIHKTDDKNASPWSCAVVGRFDYLPTMDYMLACQPSAIRELLAKLAAREAEIAPLREELNVIATANWHTWDAPYNTAAEFQAWAQSRARAALTKQPPTE